MHDEVTEVVKYVDLSFQLGAFHHKAAERRSGQSQA